MRQDGGREKRKYGKKSKVKNGNRTLPVILVGCIFAMAALSMTFAFYKKEKQKETEGFAVHCKENRNESLPGSDYRSCSVLSNH